MDHSITLHRIKMGKYSAFCTCGWISKVMGKEKALKAGESHKKDKEGATPGES